MKPANPKRDPSRLARNILLGLMVECPGGGNPVECPLHPQRGLSFSERLAWVRALDEQELEAAYTSHQRCLLGKPPP